MEINDHPIQALPKKDREEKEGNRLFPVFLKLEQLSLLIIGGGKVALEKLHAVLSNAPDTRVRIVAMVVSEGMAAEAARHDHIRIVEKPYDSSDLDGADLLIVAVNDIPLATRIKEDARNAGKLVNVADKP